MKMDQNLDDIVQIQHESSIDYQDDHIPTERKVCYACRHDPCCCEIEIKKNAPPHEEKMELDDPYMEALMQ